MIMQVYTVFDKAVGAFLQPFFVRSKGEALRSFQDACNDDKTNFSKYPSDYTLFYVATYDDSSGRFYMDGSDPVRVISALECVTMVRATVQPGDEIAERTAQDRATFARTSESSGRVRYDGSVDPRS